MNNVNLIGNLTKDPELKYTSGQSQTAIARFTVAVNEGYGDQQRTNFIPITVFGKQAESCETYLKKGSKVGVSGRIQTGSYDKEGQTVYTTDVIASRVEFLSATEKATQREPESPEEDDVPEGFQSVMDDVPF